MPFILEVNVDVWHVDHLELSSAPACRLPKFITAITTSGLKVNNDDLVFFWLLVDEDLTVKTAVGIEHVCARTLSADEIDVKYIRAGCHEELYATFVGVGR